MMYRHDPAEQAEAMAYEREMHPAGKHYVVCENCGAIIGIGGEWYETDLGPLCEGCFEDWTSERRHYVE